MEHITRDQKLDRANQAPNGIPEHNREADDPEYDRSDGEVHQVLHDDITGIFRTGKAGFHHGKACLHEEYQTSGQ